jgi:hypothetical protein
MTDLCDAQQALLTDAAAESEEGLSAEGRDAKTIKALIKQGRLISIPTQDGPSRLVATRAGLALLGPPDTPEKEPPAPAVAEASPIEAAAAPAPKVPKGKVGRLLELLRRPTGASIAEMMAATDWQAHSVRGALSGAIGKQLGVKVASEKTDVGRMQVDGRRNEDAPQRGVGEKRSELVLDRRGDFELVSLGVLVELGLPEGADDLVANLGCNALPEDGVGIQPEDIGKRRPLALKEGIERIAEHVLHADAPSVRP